MSRNVQYNPPESNGFVIYRYRSKGNFMARYYFTKDCFRQISNALPARYFQKQGLFADLDYLFCYPEDHSR